ncbi:hypothetical protein B4N89_44490 [Embleya scabrispora]|uniref:DUF4913 domain-containing protein n=1 Tax=Embleya scabrispora TaxID=159449 RepID=A0A1T3NL01_9ACTN|nr:DUF4913 domain-containing protein [Embleya scabrispora]OPC77549.1 hypothetical protein B4N89_44490 [Embleya scabrispora]
MNDPDESEPPVGRDDANAAPQPEKMFFSSVEVFVTEYLAPLLRRRLNRSLAVWCPSWWAHPEAVARLTSLWRAFEYLRRDAALGSSIWWTHHADPHLRVLMDPDIGPFAVCDPRDGHSGSPLPALPLTPVPPGLLDHPGFRVEGSLFEDMRRRDEHEEPREPRTGYPKDKVLNKNIGF